MTTSTSCLMGRTSTHHVACCVGRREAGHSWLRTENWKEFFRRASNEEHRAYVARPAEGRPRRLLMVIQPTDRIVTMEDTAVR